MAAGFDVTGMGPRKRALLVVTVLAFCFLLVSCSRPRTYSADPIRARVVDSVSGAPIEGVNVVAAWEAKGGLEGGNIAGYVMVMEDVTNAKGEFSFPGWGPKEWRNGAIRNGAPLLVLLKSGYAAPILSEWEYGVDVAPRHMTSRWNGTTIELRPFKGSDVEYSDRLTSLGIKVSSLISAPGCVWKSVPRFLVALDRLHTELASRNVAPAYSSSIEHLDGQTDSACGTVKAFLVGSQK